MPEKDLTTVQSSVLLALMIGAAPLRYSQVSNSLKKPHRVDLENRGLIEVTGSPMQLELTQKGHDQALRDLTADQPPKTGPSGLAFHVTRDFLHRLIETTGIEPRDLFRLRDLGRVAPAVAASETENDVAVVASEAGTGVEDQVRKVYADLVGHPGGHVMLADVRDALPGVPRSELDATLARMNRAADVHITPESNQKSLTERERAGAVSIGNQERHLIAIVA